jgi:hypothetical protein
LAEAVSTTTVPADLGRLVIDLSYLLYGRFCGIRASAGAGGVSSNGRTVGVAGTRGTLPPRPATSVDRNGEVLYLTGLAEALGLPLRLGPRPHERREALTAGGGAEEDDRAPGQDLARHRE